MRKRIGFILASIHTGSALNMWTGLAEEAERSGCAFFIFPGGRLDSRPDSEYLRNGIYRLANETNLDALISWGSSIGGAVSIEELNHFHHGFDALPYVTIAHKMEGHPCVSFDAYTGMKSLVSHFIAVHGARKIAFLRGPESHASSGDRYRAFRDAFAEAGVDLPAESLLVSSPFPWSAGEDAIIQLCEKRTLVPGKDFDALIGSSDMMTFSAVRYLKKHGFNIPGDVRVGGFNDSAESRILSPAFSTVHMPYKELGLMSFKIIREMLSPQRAGRSSQSSAACPPSDRILPSNVVIRESCGCRKGFDYREREDSSVPLSSDALRRGLATALRLDETGINAVLDPILSAVLSCDTALALHLFELALERFFEDNNDSGLIIDAIPRVRSLVRSSGCLPPDYVFNLEREAYLILLAVESRVHSLKQYETGKRYAALNSLKCDLLGSRDRETLVSVLSGRLPEAGIHSAALVLYEDDEFSRYIGGFSRLRIDPEFDELFPARHLLPERVMRAYEEGVFMVQPLFMENRPLGYFICSTPFHDGLVFEDLRSAVSSALKGIFLFEESVRARQDAERADRAKTEFFADAGNALCNPLSDMAEAITELRKNLSEGPMDSAVLSSRLDSLKSLTLFQLEQTNRLIELTLSGIDGLSFENRLFRIGEVFREAGFHPLLVGDPGRVSEAFGLVREEYRGPVTVSRSCAGLVVRFASSSPLPPEVRKKPGMLLAERIVVLQHGDFRADQSSCTMTLAWPNLAGLPPVHGSRPERIVLPSSGEALPDLEEFGLPVSEGIEGATDVLISWDADTASLEDWMRVYALRHHPRLFRSPFLFFSREHEGRSLIEVIERNVRSESLKPILFVGARCDRYPGWAEDENSVSIRSMEDFPSSVAEVSPALVVFDSLDLASIEAVRRDPATVLVPIVVLPDKVDSETDVAALCLIPRVILCNRGVASSPEFAAHVKKILSGEEMLPPHTGALVKKTILYFNIHATSQIVRWKLADSVNVSEDYLTRIFHRETGFSLWEYLNRYRIFLATELLLHTNDTINEIALKTGFQDQAYFCRVFKKIHGVPPGRIRSRI